MVILGSGTNQLLAFVNTVILKLAFKFIFWKNYLEYTPGESSNFCILHPHSGIAFL